MCAIILIMVHQLYCTTTQNKSSSELSRLSHRALPRCDVSLGRTQEVFQIATNGEDPLNHMVSYITLVVSDGGVAAQMAASAQMTFSGGLGGHPVRSESACGLTR